MSSLIRDCAESHKEIGELLNNFLYVNGKPKNNKNKNGIIKEHTYQELWEMLENIRKDSWNSYEQVESGLGWDR